MELNINTYGQAFSFDCDNYPGHYGLRLTSIAFDALKNLKSNGYCEFYSGNVPVWESKYVIAIFFESEPPELWWKSFLSEMLGRVAQEENIRFYTNEYCRKKSMEPSSLNYEGRVLFQNGDIIAVEDLPKDSFIAIVRPLK